MGFEYFISRKADLVVVTFQGEITLSCGESLTRCIDELAEEKPGIVILNLQANIDKESQRMFTIFQKQVRDLGAQLRICLKDEEIRRLLVSFGIVREEEMRKDLKECLLEVLNKAKK
jgi:anti-anti-sigma regulatory factor